MTRRSEKHTAQLIKFAQSRPTQSFTLNDLQATGIAASRETLRTALTRLVDRKILCTALIPTESVSQPSRHWWLFGAVLEQIEIPIETDELTKLFYPPKVIPANQGRLVTFGEDWQPDRAISSHYEHGSIQSWYPYAELFGQ